MASPVSRFFDTTLVRCPDTRSPLATMRFNSKNRTRRSVGIRGLATGYKFDRLHMGIMNDLAASGQSSKSCNQAATALALATVRVWC